MKELISADKGKTIWLNETKMLYKTADVGDVALYFEFNSDFQICVLEIQWLVGDTVWFLKKCYLIWKNDYDV